MLIELASSINAGSWPETSNGHYKLLQRCLLGEAKTALGVYNAGRLQQIRS
jgi:hypothetical protein